MADRDSSDLRADMFFMLVAAGVFAYFGFGTQWLHQSAITGQTLLFVVILDYTLKGAAIGMGASIALSFVHRDLGRVLYAIVGLASAIAFVAVAILDWLDPQHTAMSPILLLVFAAWNGYGSIASLNALFRERRLRSKGESAEARFDERDPTGPHGI